MSVFDMPQLRKYPHCNSSNTLSSMSTKEVIERVMYIRSAQFQKLHHNVQLMLSGIIKNYKPVEEID